MTEWQAIGAAAVALFFGAVSPGPSLAVVVRATVAGGRDAGVACAVGHGLGFAAYASAVIFGLGFVMARAPLLFAALQWLGVVLLLYLAYKTVAGGAAQDARASSRGSFWIGFLTALFNPKIALFFVAVFSAVLQPDMSLTTQLTIAALGWFIDTGWYVLVATALTAPAAVAALERAGPWIDRAMAALFVFLALATVVRLTQGFG